MKNSNQVYTTDSMSFKFDHHYYPYAPTSTAIDYSAQLYNCTSRESTSRESTSRKSTSRKSTSRKSTSRKSTSRRHRQKRSNFKVFAFQFITIALCIVLLWISFTVIYNSLCLFSIGNEVAEMGPVRKTDSNYPRYCELQNKRVEIKKSSFIGYLLVITGGDDLFGSLIRGILIIFALIATLISIIYIAYIIKVDIAHFKTPLSKMIQNIKFHIYNIMLYIKFHIL